MNGSRTIRWFALILIALFVAPLAVSAASHSAPAATGRASGHPVSAMVVTANGTMTGTVRRRGTTQGIAGATIEATIGSTTYSTTANSSGVYSLSLPAGTYSTTAYQTGYFPSDPVNVAVSSGTTTTKNFSLERIACSPCP